MVEGKEEFRDSRNKIFDIFSSLGGGWIVVSPLSNSKEIPTFVSVGIVIDDKFNPFTNTKEYYNKKGILIFTDCVW